jgi:hypothetical protein
MLDQKNRAAQNVVNDRLRQIQRAAHTYSEMFMLELNTGGNVRVEDGNPRSPWWSTCSELLHSSLTADDAERLDLQLSLDIRRVARIHNRACRSRFEHAMCTQVPQSRSETQRVFWVEPDHLPDELNRVVQSGFRNPEEYGR